MPIGPSRTAEMVCAARAAERLRPGPQRIVDDRYARYFLRPSVRNLLAARRRPLVLGRIASEVQTFVLCRHRAIDDWMSAALDAGASQIVVLGAGYDTRAWRFRDQIGDRKLFELDFAATQERKRHALAAASRSMPAANVEMIAVDFERESFEDRLQECGFRATEPTFFIWEGVSYYLTRQSVGETLEAIHRLGGPSSELVADFWYLVDAPDVLSQLRRVSPNLLALLGEPFLFNIHPEDLGGFLARSGLELIEAASADDLERRIPAVGRRSIYPAFYLARAGW